MILHQFEIVRTCPIEGTGQDLKPKLPEVVWVHFPAEDPNYGESVKCDQPHYRVAVVDAQRILGIAVRNRFVCEHMGRLIE